MAATLNLPNLYRIRNRDRSMLYMLLALAALITIFWVQNRSTPSLWLNPENVVTQIDGKISGH